jgi:hypothetical protein
MNVFGLYLLHNSVIQHIMLNMSSYTTWKVRAGKEAKHTIDYIFYRSAQFKVLSFVEMPAETDIEPNRLPSFKYPSDHMALIGTLAVEGTRSAVSLT